MLDGSNKKWPFLIIGIFSIPLFFLGIHDLHGWGDDFAQYIQQAKNIANGRPYYESSWIFNATDPTYAPPQYPPGFPILIAPVIRWFGLNIRPLLYFNSAVIVCLYFVLFKWFLHRTHVIVAICASTICVYCGFVIDAKQSVLSDIPCWLFVASYFLIRDNLTFSWRQQVLLGICLLIAILIRTQSVFIIAAEMIYLSIEIIRAKGRRWNIVRNSVPARTSIVVLCLFFVLNATIFKAPVSTLSFYIHDLTFHTEPLWSIIGNNANYLLTLFPEILHYTTVDPFWQSLVTIIEYSFLIFGILGCIKSFYDDPKPIDFYFIFMCLIILIFPMHQGARYIISVMPLFLWYCYTTMRLIIPNILHVKGWKICIGFTLIYLILGYDDFKRSTEKIPGSMPGKSDLVAFQFLKQHVHDSDIIAFVKPRALALYTGKHTVNISWSITPEENARYFEHIKTTYILVFDGLGYKDFRNVLGYMQPKDSTIIADGYHLFRVR